MTLAFNEKLSHYFECFFPIIKAWLLLQSDVWSLYAKCLDRSGPGLLPLLDWDIMYC